MKKSRFTESQIIAAIQKQENGMSTREVCRELGISEPTFYNWKAKYGGMAVSDVQKMKSMEAELSQSRNEAATRLADAERRAQTVIEEAKARATEEASKIVAAARKPRASRKPALPKAPKPEAPQAE